MRVKISSAQAEKMGLRPETELLIRSCFYLGHGVIFTSEMVSNLVLRREEANDIISMATALGMSDEDTVSLYENDLAAGATRAERRGTDDHPDADLPQSAGGGEGPYFV